MSMDLKDLSDEEVREMLAAYAADPLSADEVRLTMELDSRGRMKQSPANRLRALRFDPVLRGRLRYNEFSGRPELPRDMPAPWTRQRPGDGLTDTDLAVIVNHLYDEYGLLYTNPQLKTAVDAVCEEQRFHPVRELLESLQWDGVPRVASALHHFLGAELSPYNAAALRLHMLAAVRRVYEPGAKYDCMLCLSGRQGIGKSTFFRFLAMKDAWFLDDVRRLDDTDLLIRMQGRWIVEAGEMGAVYNSRSMEDLKAFISRQSDSFRRPYAVNAEDRPRQFVLCGTSNSSQIIPFDRSGARRFLPVEVGVTEPEVHILEDEAASRAYFARMWAEIMAEYRAGNTSLVMPRELAETVSEMQSSMMPEDTELGVIQSWLERENKKQVCTKELWHECLEHPRQEELPKWKARELGEILEKLGWRQGRQITVPPYGRQRGWMAPKPAQFSLLTDDDPNCPFT